MKRFLFALVLLLLAINSRAEFKLSDFPDSKVDSIKILNYIMEKSDVSVYIEENNHDIQRHKYEVSKFSYLSKRFEWHAYASNIIFFIVLLIVLAGLVFSGVQFYLSLKRSNPVINHTIINTPGKIAPVTGEINPALPNAVPAAIVTDPVTTIKVSTSGIEASSSILGVIILVISIVFFYLYLTIVYPMKEIDDQKFSDNPAKTEKPK